MNTKSLTVAAYQGNAVYGSVAANLEIISKVILEAEANKVDIICFPECFLTGYILNEEQARLFSIEFDSDKFTAILQRLNSKSVTIILGLIEQENGLLYNTAVIIKRGKLIGKYRKQNLLKKEAFFQPGNESTVFEIKGIKFGINICSDTRYPESVASMAKQGAQLLFFPLNNSLPHETAAKWNDKHTAYWVERAQETSCWVITSDVVEKSATNTGFGFTTLIDPQGKIVVQLKHFKTGLLFKTIKF